MVKEDRIERFRKAYERALACQWKGGPASITNHLQKVINFLANSVS